MSDNFGNTDKKRSFERFFVQFTGFGAGVKF